MSLAKENAELRDRLTALEAQVAKLAPKPPAPPPEQNPIRITQSFYEVWSVVNGRRGAHPIAAPSKKRAEEEAAHLARGTLLDHFGNRAPSRPIFELADGESLDDVAADGVYVTKRVVDGSHQLNF